MFVVPDKSNRHGGFDRKLSMRYIVNMEQNLYSPCQISLCCSILKYSLSVQVIPGTTDTSVSQS